MKKFHKIFVVLLLSFIILLGGYVNAATDSSEKLGEIKITSSSNKVQKGESFYIIISAESFGEDENGKANTLDGYSGKVNYNTEDLELVSTELIDTEHWANMSGNTTELAAMWLTEQEDGVTLEETKADIYKITFKVKEDTNAENTAITLSDNILSAGKYIVEVDDISLDIELTNIVTEEDPDDPDDDNSNDEDAEIPGIEEPDNSDDENRDEENDDNSNEDKKDEEQSEKENQINNIIIGNDDGDTTNTLNKYNGQSSSTADSSTSSKTLPYAGKFLAPIIITLLIGVVTYGTIGYLKYNKYKKI